MKKLLLSTAFAAATGLGGWAAYADATTAAADAGVKGDVAAGVSAAANDVAAGVSGDIGAGAGGSATTGQTGAELAASTDVTTQTDAAVTPPDAAAATGAVTARVPVVREGFEAYDMTAITSDVLIGAKVYDSTDASVGEVSQLVIAADGQVTDIVVDVGGFLGIGEKPVALKLADVDILRATGGAEVRVYVSLTKDQMEALPTYVNDAG